MILKTNIFLKDQVIIYPDDVVSQPLVSVIMPTYCRGDSGLLSRAIDSVLKQSFKNFELIIVDDGSIDNTASIINSYQRVDNRVIHIRHNLNSGLPALRVNEGLMVARGQFISYQFDDDEWTEEALEVLLEEISNYTTPALVYGSCVYYKDSVEHVFSHDFDYSSLMDHNIIANNSVMHHISLFREFGGYDCHVLMRRLCDWDLWLRWSRKVPFKHVHKVISNVTIGEEFSLGQTIDYDLGTFRILNRVNRDLNLTPGMLQEYDILSLDFLESIYKEPEINTIYLQHVLPWVLRHREIYAAHSIDLNYSLFVKKTILVTAPKYNKYIKVLEDLKSIWTDRFFFFFVPEEQLESKFYDVDNILAINTNSEKSSVFLAESKRKGKAIIFFLDEGMLSNYENEPSSYKELERQIRLSDVVLSNTIKKISSALSKKYTINVLDLSAMPMCQTAEKDYEIYEKGNIDAYKLKRITYGLLAILEASVFHARTRNVKAGIVQKKIAYFCHSPYLGGAENHLLRHAQIASKYGIEPIWCLPEHSRDMEEANIKIAQEYGFKIIYLPIRILTEPEESFLSDENIVALLTNWLNKEQISLVHSVTLMPDLSIAVKNAGIPYVSSLYAFKSSSSTDMWKHYSEIIHSDSLVYTNKWSHVLGTHGRCIRSWIPGVFLENGRKRLLTRDILTGEKIKVAMSGTLQERKGQVEAIQAVGELKKKGIEIELHIYGYCDFYPEYKARCEEIIADYYLYDSVFLHGFKDNPEEYLSKVDILLCASDFESMPQAILEAMAAGVFIISTPAGGILEVIKDGYTGIITKNNSSVSISEGLVRTLTLERLDFLKILNNAYELVFHECNYEYVSYELLKLYNSSLEICKQRKVVTQNITEDFMKKYESWAEGYIYEENVKQTASLKLLPLSSFKNRRRYSITVRRNFWSGFSFMPGTHGTVLEGRIEIYIFSNENCTNYERVVSIDMEHLNDNELYVVWFEPIEDSENKKFNIEFNFNYRRNGKKIALFEWVAEDFSVVAKLKNKHQSKGYQLAGDLIYKINDSEIF